MKYHYLPVGLKPPAVTLTCRTLYVNEPDSSKSNGCVNLWKEMETKEG